MSKIELRPATPIDILSVAHRLREADREEVIAATGRGPERVLPENAEGAWVGLVDGVPAALYGLALGQPYAAPWLLGTPALEGRRLGYFMVTYGRGLFRKWAAEHGELRNFAYAKNTLHLKFIRALGCELLETKPHGALGFPFTEFRYVLHPRSD